MLRWSSMGILGYLKIIAHIAHNLDAPGLGCLGYRRTVAYIAHMRQRLGGMGAFWQSGLPIAKCLNTRDSEMRLGNIVILCIF
jgi:hypothetical protein